jgi:hypothetical protein
MIALVRLLSLAATLLALAACVTDAAVTCHYGPSGWQCDGGAGGSPPTGGGAR